MTEVEALEEYPLDGLQEIVVGQFIFHLCPHCAYVSAQQYLVVKCKCCGSVTELPRVWEIYERFAEKIGMPASEMMQLRMAFFSINAILLMDACPNCKICPRGVAGRG
jgi:hypothetical protein